VKSSSIPLKLFAAAALLSRTACIGNTQELTATEIRELFPSAAATPKADHAPVTVKLGKEDSVALTPVRFAPAPGQSQAVNTNWCGVILRSPGFPPQGTVTIGTGSTEALSCNGVDEIGVVPASGSSARIGLIYQTTSPNASSRTPVILVRDPKSRRWTVADELSEKMAELPGRASLASLRRALAAR
jgi:hypothetical protein